MKLRMTITACFLIPCYVGFRTVGVSPMAHNEMALTIVFKKGVRSDTVSPCTTARKMPHRLITHKAPFLKISFNVMLAEVDFHYPHYEGQKNKRKNFRGGFLIRKFEPLTNHKHHGT